MRLWCRDDAIEGIAIDAVIAYERARGCEVESVESDNRGFDIISRKPHPEDPKTAIEVRWLRPRVTLDRRGKMVYHPVG